jgi:hypothetical protein
MLKGSAMSLRHSPTIDELLSDSLIQAVMRADKVEPQALRTLLDGVAGRIVAAGWEREPRSPVALASGPPLERRTTARALARPRPAAPVAGPCGSAMCC